MSKRIENQVDEYLFEKAQKRKQKMFKYGGVMSAVIAIFTVGILIGQNDVTVITAEVEKPVIVKEVVETIKGVNSHDIDSMAVTVYGESKFQIYDGQVAVAHTINNRYKMDASCGSIAEVVREANQFSIWNKNDPSYELVENMVLNPQELEDDDLTRKRHAVAWKIAFDVLTGRSKDPTGGATMYLNPKAVKKIPEWFKVCKDTVQIGDHHFCYYDGNYCDRS